MKFICLGYCLHENGFTAYKFNFNESGESPLSCKPYRSIQNLCTTLLLSVWRQA
jgi:hypothetical protein